MKVGRRVKEWQNKAEWIGNGTFRRSVSNFSKRSISWGTWQPGCDPRYSLGGILNRPHALCGVRVKVKISIYRPRQVLRAPGVGGLQISRQSAHEGAKFTSPTHWPFYSHRGSTWYSQLSDAESIPGPQFGRKDYINKRILKTTSGNRNRELPTCSATACLVGWVVASRVNLFGEGFFFFKF